MSYAHVSPRRSLLAVVVALAALLLVPGWAAAKQKTIHDNGIGKVVNTMTRNLYLGADLTPAIGAPSLEDFVAANGQILREVTENDFPTRAKGLADEILDKQAGPGRPAGGGAVAHRARRLRSPDRKGRARPRFATTTCRNCSASSTKANRTTKSSSSRTSSTSRRRRTRTEIPRPDRLRRADINGRLTMRDVILARRGAGVQTWNEQGANFKTLLAVPILGGTGSLTIKRGWTATDAKVRGSHPFRFVNTHLEAFQPLIRAAQAGELVAPDGSGDE